ncbi:unnamed protein product [Cuscuta epithymum]|uniref:RNase H type-1 domain-containing protein n=1 Tax=Cuscuta epithymum TaxID=186058 RepID=A0AAV0CNW4_9ASTE|nr:unnamed protein product [Cuscuta epithymum]
MLDRDWMIKVEYILSISGIREGNRAADFLVGLGHSLPFGVHSTRPFGNHDFRFIRLISQLFHQTRKFCFRALDCVISRKSKVGVTFLAVLAEVTVDDNFSYFYI